MKKIVAIVLMLSMLLCCGVEAFGEDDLPNTSAVSEPAPNSASESVPETVSDSASKSATIRDTVTIVIGAEPEAEEDNPNTGAPVFIGLMAACAVCGAFVLKRKN